MRTKALALCCAAVTLSLVPVRGQSPFYPIPARVLGQTADPNNSGQSKSYSPNLVEGRELYSPQSVALDTTVSPARLYIADTLNNRVLGWSNASAAGGDSTADIVIGQPDKLTTRPNNPGLQTGLNQPSAVAVDRLGNLWVIDAGNNRILRFPKPFESTSSPKEPDAVLGQPEFNTRTANNGGLSATSLTYTAWNTVYPGALAFDANGNLYVTDTGNNRVLMYAGAAALENGSKGIAAAKVIGQDGFTSSTTQGTVFSTMNRLVNPAALTIDPDGRVYIADRLSRVLVFESNVPQQAGSAIGRLGVYNPQTGQPYQPPTQKSLLNPQGLAMIGSELLVMDTGNSRILRFPPFSQWPALPDSPAATAVIGQASFTISEVRSGAAGLSLPLHAVYSGSELFVADYGNNRVMVFPGAGPTASRFVGQMNADANGPNIVDGKGLFLSGAITTPGGTTVVGGGVALDRRTDPLHLYAADTFNNRVLGFCDVRKSKPGDDPTLVIGQPDMTSARPNYNPDGTSNSNDSNLKAPMGVAVDGNGHLYVADWGNGRVLRFPEPCANPGGPHRANLVLGQSSFTATRQTSPSSTVMGEPYGLAFLPEGYLLVSDRAFNRVLRFDKPANGDFSNGQAAATVFGQSDFFGSAPSTSSQSAPPDRMRDPRYIATDTSGRLYVADSGNRRVLVFTEVASAGSGTSAAFVLTRGLSNDALGETHGIYVSPNTGEIWMTGLSDSRLYRYDEYRVLSLKETPSANLRLTMATPGMGIALDEVGALYITEQGNRISLYASPAVATDAAAFVAGGQLAPGMIATIWPSSAAGFRGTDVAGAASIPLPRTLADTQVLVNGQPVPLFYVSGSQINFQVPNNAPQTGTIDLQVIRPSTGEILAAGAAAMRTAQPRFFLKQTSGQVAAINNDDGSCNGEQQAGPSTACPGGTRRAKRGEFVLLYLTGHGYVDGMAPEGEATPAGSQLTTPAKPVVALSSGSIGDADWSGPAPQYVGLWQINYRVPDTATGQVFIGISYRDVPSTVPQGYAKPFMWVQ